MTMKALPRVFCIGATQIEDTAPHLSLDDAVRWLSQEYPQFRQTRLYEEDGRVENGKMMYTLVLPPVKVNG